MRLLPREESFFDDFEKHAQKTVEGCRAFVEMAEGKVSAAEKQAIEDAVAALKAAVGTENMSDIAAKTQTLIQASMKLGEAMYASGAASSGDDTDGDSKDDGVVDAEFEEVDGKKSA